MPVGPDSSGLFTHAEAMRCGFSLPTTPPPWPCSTAHSNRAGPLLRSAGIAGWTANAAIRDSAGLIGYGDLVFAAALLVVELDGWAFHSDPARFPRDRTRQNRLVTAGWTVLRRPPLLGRS